MFHRLDFLIFPKEWRSDLQTTSLICNGSLEVYFEGVPNNENLYVVTRDSDFKSSLDDNKPHPLLSKEWMEIKKGTLYVYKTLSDFLKNEFSCEDIPCVEKNDEYTADNLRREIKNVYSFLLLEEGKGGLSNWQIAQIVEAIKAYRIGWFYLARNCLDLALVKE